MLNHNQKINVLDKLLTAVTGGKITGSNLTLTDKWNQKLNRGTEQICVEYTQAN